MLNEIGERIKKARLKKNYTQEELGELLFISPKTISSWEIGRTVPDFDVVHSISKILDCSFISLLQGNLNTSNVEVEAKFKVDKKEFDRILGIIKKDSVFLSNNTQIDSYYSSSSFEDKEWIRIRTSDTTSILSYKRWYQNKYCDEYEVYIDNKDNLEKILFILGVHFLVTVKKDRIKYLYADKWIISFDNVDHLGLFIEIESLNPNSSNPCEEFNKIIEIAEQFDLKLNQLSSKRYPEYFI